MSSTFNPPLSSYISNFSRYSHFQKQLKDFFSVLKFKPVSRRLDLNARPAWAPRVSAAINGTPNSEMRCCGCCQYAGSHQQTTKKQPSDGSHYVGGFQFPRQLPPTTATTSSSLETLYTLCGRMTPLNHRKGQSIPEFRSSSNPLPMQT